MDRNFNEMTETEATLENQLDNLDFMVYQLTTGSIFTADEPRDQATIDKINKLTGKASDQLISAMETLIELKSIVNNSVEVLPEDAERDFEEIEEVDYADAIPSLYGAKVTNIENVKFENENGVLIEFDTVDGSRAKLIYAMGSLYHVGGGEI